MNAERLVTMFSIAIVLFAIGYAGSAALAPGARTASAEIAPPPPTARASATKLETLDRRRRVPHRPRDDRR